MQLLAFLVASALLAIVLRRRAVALVGVALALRFFVPSVASVVFTGSSSDAQLHPASYFLAAAFVVSLFTRPEAFGRELGRRPLFYGVLVAVLVASVVTTVMQVIPAFAYVLIDTLGFGILLCLMVRVAIDNSAVNGRRIAYVLIALAACQAALAIVQWSTGRTLLWESYMANYYWWSPTQIRTSGTIGAWLDLATLLAVAVPLTAAIQHLWLRFSTAVLLIVGIVLAQGRTALIVSGVCLLLLLLSSSIRLDVRLLLTVALIAVGFFFGSGQLGAGITERYATDTLSGDVREQAAVFALARLPLRPWYGGGFGSNGDTRESGLISSFENGYLMYAWDIGIVATFVLFVAIASPLLIGRRHRLVPGSWLALGVILFLIGTFSGVQTPGPTAWVLFAVVGLNASNRPRRDASHAEPRTIEAAVFRETPVRRK